MILQTDMYRDYLSETRPMIIKAAHPWGLRFRIPAKEGLRQVIPTHLSRQLYLQAAITAVFLCS